MSAQCVIRQLKSFGYFVCGCDIYPGEWHYETKLCDSFFQAPYATQVDEYVHFLIDTCKRLNINYIIPLTDIEIDVINTKRELFKEESINLCMQTSKVLKIARNKYLLYKSFINDPIVPSIRTYLIKEIPSNFSYPCIAKPINGRSSEGLIRSASREQIMAIPDKGKYIVQDQLVGDIYTVDYCRSEKTGQDVAIPRIELLRTKNGAGLTVQTINDLNLIRLSSYIGDKLNINGCINFEFIRHNSDYYLIDINPRFSAGIAFSFISGYDMILNHIRCFINQKIDEQIPIKEQILIKRYDEVII